MSKNFKELKQKGISLTRDNFTFSSKLIVGTFLRLKEPFLNLLNSFNGNAQQANIEFALNQLIDDSIDDKLKRVSYLKIIYNF